MGGRVNVGGARKQDERYADLAYGMRDSFHQARSQLQDEEHLMDDRAGFGEEETIGTVVRIDPGAHSASSSDKGHEIYFNCISASEGRGNLVVGSRVNYVEELGEDGLQAFAIKVLSK
ncbi:hypothetical protein H8A97_36675 [Bradyrhizobium sp. Arg62]|uniref:hypothetical protein n=1 Tax=Bradyrhizobium TaxID=374 RepID=UPI001E48DDD9|nr:MULTISPECIES: hypothetical protein [Bradyrhizobium]MCC8941050.1 hypothetical protein [Bradyrhizobium ivorense]MCC8950456.1 hypothetical protein [Bradyrhizobium brasilense]